ncbi:MAG: cation-translocating P-type ATPase [Flavobacteriales bacterium]
MQKADADKNFHARTKEEVASAMTIDAAKGLSKPQAAERLKQYGANSITEKKKVSPFVIFITQFKNPIVLLLVLAALFSFWFKEWIDGIAVFAVIIINAVIGFYMEYRAERSMEAIKKISMTKAKVQREGKLMEIDSEAIVPGDIVFVEAGDIVPADGRIWSLSQLKVDESALTGESLPVEKNDVPVDEKSSLGDRKNMLYKGTHVSKGNSYVIITGTGMNTELGRVATLVDSTAQASTPLEKKLEEFSKKLMKVTMGLVVLIFVVGILNGQELMTMLKSCIALAVAAIPEGLPIVATMALAQGMIKMARQNIIVKKLSAVEILGGTDVICADKTGTLTKNQIEVREIFPVVKNVEGIIKEISILCNTADLHKVDGKMKELGDPLETALLKYYGKENLNDIEALRANNPKVNEEPFSSETKIMATLHKAGDKYMAYAKGATEELIPKCKSIVTDAGEMAMDETTRKYWFDEAEKHAAAGMRVIAVAYKSTTENEKNLSSDLVFAGLIGMIDPPREEVSAAIEECHSAGINVIMITGDHPATASSIAKQLKITDEKSFPVLIGKDMKDYEHLSQDDKQKWEASHVFARVSPKQKLDIVSVLQEKKHIVGMTGDGINDAPALKKADIGIAMGQRGTQVAQEVAVMVIKDDSFTAIVKAVKQGRIIFENIRKCVVFLLSCNLSELFVISIASVFNLPFQLFTLQILFMNIITDVLPALALGVTDASEDIMKKPPRPVSEPIIDKKRWITIIVYSAVMSLVSIGAVVCNRLLFNRNEETLTGNNILFFTLIFCQLLQVFNMGNSGTFFFKSEVIRNKYVWFSVVMSAAVLRFFYFIAPLRQVLSIHSMSASDWLVCALASVAFLLIIQILKAFKLIKQ